MPTDDRLQSLLKMLEAEPDDAFCLYGVAQEYAGRDDHAQAESFYLKAIAAAAPCFARPDDAASWAARAARSGLCCATWTTSRHDSG